MTGYGEQRRVVRRLHEDKDRTTPLEAKILSDVLETINRAEGATRLRAEIYAAAKKNREFCVHCDSVAKVIEDFQK